jgi:4-hydroxy-4-methyl-2-oxoglutarate aldolase
MRGKSPSSASVHEASGKRGALPSDIKPVHPSFRLTGAAFTVLCPPGDNLRLHHALYAAAPGDVLVVDVSGGEEHGYWGEVLSEAAKALRLGGLVINGGVRDVSLLPTVGFPVFATRICVRGTGKDPYAPGALGVPLRFGDVAVEPGDLVIGDADGVVAVRRDDADRVLRLATEREAGEVHLVSRLRQGERTTTLYGLADL